MHRVLFGVLIVLFLAGCGAQTAPPGDADGISTAAPDASSTTQSPDDATATGQPSQPPSGGPALPDGWRWESYGGVQVGVPGDWGVGGAYSRIYQWCMVGPASSLTPVIGRPEPITAVGCVVDDPAPDVPPELLLEYTGPVVALGGSDQPDGTTHEGDRTTVHRAGVAVIIHAEPDLREQIAATVHTVDVDDALCPVSHQIAQDSTYRPATDAAVSTDVTAISACRYALTHPNPAGDRTHAPLISSLRLTGAAAQDAAQGIEDAPTGGGPNSPDTCLADWSYGEEVIVLLITSTSGGSEVVLRYGGCDHHGFDDGSTIRTLTAPAVAPFIQAPNLVTEASYGMADILFPSSDQTDRPDHTDSVENTDEPVGSDSPGDAEPFSIYTHCGIDEVHYQGEWYERIGGVLDDGNGNPPSGWDNGDHPGSMARIDDTTIVFTDDRGHEEHFTLRAGATEPKRFCA